MNEYNLSVCCVHSLQIADIREFEEFADTISDTEQYPLYQSAMRHFEETPIPVRQIRTELVNCSSDLEYLAKLHCIRLAFQYLFRVTYAGSSPPAYLNSYMLSAEVKPPIFCSLYRKNQPVDGLRTPAAKY